MPETIEAALEALRELHPKKIDLGLERIERVLKKLGNPQTKLPPTVHVAGTNGKGSTIAFLRAMAEAQGLRVHVYTSPHLVKFHERIVLASEQIDDDTLMDVLTRVRDANGDEPLSFFEATTAAAFLAFSECQADLCILEVGLGGRYDATNVIDHPALVGITPVDYDHAEFLGNDLAGIAREKAGIMKWAAPAIFGFQSDLVRAVLNAEADKLNIRPEVWGEGYRAYKENGRLIFEDDNEVMDLPLPLLPGPHQLVNAGLAIALAKHLQLSRKAIATGLETVTWPARLQVLRSGPLVDKVLTWGGELWLDGGHNPHAGKFIAEHMASLENKQPRPLILVLGMLANKNILGYLEAYEGLARYVIAVPIPDHFSAEPDDILATARILGIAAYAEDNVEAAVNKALMLGDDMETAPRILICGSLYLAGTVLEHNR